MSKKSFGRLIRIITGTFGSARDDAFAVETGLTRLERFAHFWVLVIQSFNRNRCPVRASALSFTTLLALIPMLAVAMSVSSFFLKQKSEQQVRTFVEQFIEHMVPNDLTVTNETPVAVSAPATNAAPETVVATESLPTDSGGTNNVAPATTDNRIENVKQRAADTIFNFIQSTQSGKLGIVAILVLFWATIRMLTSVETTFNDIWGVVQGRNWLSRIVLYWAAMTLGTMLIMGALGMASGPHFERTRELLDRVPFLEPLVSMLLPVVIIGITFALFYKLVPNTRVDFSAAFVGGALAGTAWHIFNVVSIHFATRVVTASKIYGSLALIPLLMLGLYTVWVIILFGAQVAYAFQNRELYLQERLAENVNQRGREFVALRLMTCIGQRFARGLPPPTVQEISRELGIPSKLVQQVLQTLLAARLVVEVAGAQLSYAPARPLEAINAHHVLIAMRATVGQDFITNDEPVRAEIYGEFARIQAAEESAASAVTMLALVNRTHPQLTSSTSVSVEPKSEQAVIAPLHGETGERQAEQTTDIEITTLTEPTTGDSASEVPTSKAAEATVPQPEQDATVAAKTVASETPFASASNDDKETFPL